MSNQIYNFINLTNGEENKDKVLENVKSNISFRGSNIWILACAILIACTGLLVNSTAVIIGAMLISPLMGPIVGAGFALAMYDFDLLKKSAKNLLIATAVSLSVATIFFYISPFKETQSELLARTYPTIYDVIIAFFGGLVGVIAITRVEKGNPIPGVAIATALMPPLCTAGYAISIGNFSYFFGAFYLYSINCFFICIATFLIIKYLKYKPIQYVNQQAQQRIKYGITGLLFLMLIPSLFLAYNLLNQKKYTQNIENFIHNEFEAKGFVLIYKKVKQNSSPKEIELAFLTKKFDSIEIQSLNKELLNYKIKDTKLIIKQDVNDLKNEILNEIGNKNQDISEKDLIINKLKQELITYKLNHTDLWEEMPILFPEIKSYSIGRHLVNQNTDSVRNQLVVLYKIKNTEQSFDREKFTKWLQQKLETNKLIVINEEK